MIIDTQLCGKDMFILVAPEIISASLLLWTMLARVKVHCPHQPGTP